MSFDYSTSGLPENPQWEKATQICNEWLNKNMSMFGPERIANFMKNQPVSAAKAIIENCPDYSEESITLALLGPAKGILIEAETMSRQIFGDRAVNFMKALAKGQPEDAEMVRDSIRLFLVEGLSTMRDQLIGRAKIDAHHQVRWNILNHLESNFAQIQGHNPGLDKIFGEALVKSREALEALGPEPTGETPPPANGKRPRGPTPPGH